MRLLRTAPVLASVLTQALKASVPNVGGIDVEPEAVVIRAITPPFSAAEQQTITDIVNNHDGATLIQLRATRKAEAKEEVRDNLLMRINLSQLDAAIDGLDVTNPTVLRTILKRLARYLRAQHELRG